MFKKYKEKQRVRKLKKQTSRAVVALWRIDISMQKDGWSRQHRRQFWRDFIKSPKLRDRIFGEIVGLK